MDESFLFPIVFNGEELEFEVKLVPFGYTHRFIVDVDGIEVYFEPDEERQYRAILSDEAIEKNLVPNVQLVKQIGKAINKLVDDK